MSALQLGGLELPLDVVTRATAERARRVYAGSILYLAERS